MINKEVIELLGNSIEGTVYPKDGTSHYKVNPHIFHQALALLKKEQPPASDFTKEIRQYLKDKKKSTGFAIWANANDLCDRLDASEASRKELVEVCKSLLELIDSLEYAGEPVVEQAEMKQAKAAIERAEK